MLEQVRNPDNILIRPLIPASHGFHVDLVNLIPSCWSEKPLSRPRLGRIRNTIFGVLAHYSSNIVDHMVATMETQAADLEQTVATLTKELNEERSKANQFLHQLMPPYYFC
uniref:Guanylate cyclase n=1 Tax=Plectus sambesii TaxID=2011161 RepID=A0A914V9V3_9BILA